MVLSESEKERLKISCGGCYNYHKGGKKRERDSRRGEVIKILGGPEILNDSGRVFDEALIILCDACRETSYKTPYLQRFLRLKEKEESNRGK